MAEQVSIASVTYGKDDQPIVLLSDGKELTNLIDVQVDGFVALGSSQFQGSLRFIGARHLKRDQTE